MTMKGQGPTALLSSACTLVACVALTWSSGMDYWSLPVVEPRNWHIPLPWLTSGAGSPEVVTAAAPLTTVEGEGCVFLAASQRRAACFRGFFGSRLLASRYKSCVFTLLPP